MKIKSKKTYPIGNKDEWGERGTKLLYYSPKQTASDFQANSGKVNEEQNSAGLTVKNSQRLNTMNKPFSMRTRR